MSRKVDKVVEILEMLEQPTKPTGRQILKIQKQVPCCQKTVYNAIHLVKKKYKNLTKYYNDVNSATEIGLYYYTAIEVLMRTSPDERGDLPVKTQQDFFNKKRKLEALRREYGLDRIDIKSLDELVLLIRQVLKEKEQKVFGLDLEGKLFVG